MSEIYTAFATVLLGGALIAIQGPINATLGRALGSSVNASFISFLVGTIALGIIVGVLRAQPNWESARALPWWAWLGGLCGAVFVTAATFAAPRLGVATMLTLAIASQLITAIAIDNSGAFGIARHAVSGGRMLGVALVVVGAILVRKY